jgi:protein-S-isoprenylcysteine O-methyltransferase Ste14
MTTAQQRRSRIAQYLGFITIMVGFFLHRPTLLALVMFPVLVLMYVRRARREEWDALAEFGDEYAWYAAVTPAFIPRWRPREPRDAHGAVARATER